MLPIVPLIFFVRFFITLRLSFKRRMPPIAIEIPKEIVPKAPKVIILLGRVLAIAIYEGEVIPPMETTIPAIKMLIEVVIRNSKKANKGRETIKNKIKVRILKNL